ncbi:hypothetical protein EHS15_02705 [Leptospira idonii]|uniref:Uncharacterized protein n=2 Tax=Leptospira idonii TaxID=1193500 RepID=A0A4R9M308_9LEPT|nr:hypothetical protein EHS15_02705 [Leptospira idonii]
MSENDRVAQQINPTRETFKSIISWIAGIFFLLLAIASLVPEQFHLLGFFTYGIISYLLIPPFKSYLERLLGSKIPLALNILIIVICFIAGSSTMPGLEKEIEKQRNMQSQTKEPEPQQRTQSQSQTQTQSQSQTQSQKIQKR